MFSSDFFYLEPEIPGITSSGAETPENKPPGSADRGRSSVDSQAQESEVANDANVDGG